MNGDYTILEKSMNGVKTLSDGISIISNGIATHENIYYTDFIKSEDEKTILLNDTITTETINVDTLNALDIVSDEVSTGILSCDFLYVNDVNNPLQDVLEVDGNLKKLKMYGQSEFRDVVSIIDKNMTQTQGGSIQQTGTNFNTLKDTKINGFLEVGSNITQTGGSSTLKDITCDNITMNTNKGITQSGSGVSNTFGSATVTNLTITGSVTFPSNVEIPGTTTSDDIIMNGSSVITQDITVSTTKFNKFRYTKMLDIDVDGNINQTKAGATATLKNTTIQGTCTLQGDIEQTAGFTKLNTIECNNITLRADNYLNISGSGKISQTGTGVNSMSAISLNNNQNLTFNGTGIISQPLNGTNILSHFRTAGFGIIGGRNNTSFSHTQNIQNNNGLQFQYNRDNSSFYSYLMNNRTGAGGGFRFQRYNGAVYVDEPLVIDDNITMNKDLNIVGKSISASSATLGIISQDEINCLDNCDINIKVKFNNLDSQIADLQTTTSGVTSNTTGITYNSGSDTTTIDNNLIVSSGKSFTLGTTNVNTFITNTNTFITAATNTLQGIVYTGGNDTTTINNNVDITGSLVVQGLDIKAEIDALETSFTTGTLTSTNLTTGTLNVTNHMNFTNPSFGVRQINGLGYFNMSNLTTGVNNAMQLYNVGNDTLIVSNVDNSHFSFRGKNIDGVNTLNRFFIIPNAANDGYYNPTSKKDDVLVFGAGNANDVRSLNMTVWSGTATGVRVEPSRTTMSGGSNNIFVDSSQGIQNNGIVNFNTLSRYNSGSNITEVGQNSNDFTINNKASTSSKIKLNIQDSNVLDVGLNNITFNTSLVMNNTAEFIPNYILDSSFPKTLSNKAGVINNGGYITVSEFKKTITISTPFSVFRQYSNIQTGAGFTNNIQDILNGVNYTIFKNGVSFATGSCNVNNSLPKVIGITSSSSTNSRSYEVYMTNIIFTFTPDYQKVSATYSFSFTPQFEIDIPFQESNIVIEEFGYYVNTAQSGTTTGLSIGFPGNNFSSANYSLTEYGTKYLTGSGTVKLNDVFTNTIDNQNNISTNSLTVSTTTTSNTFQGANVYCSGNFRANAGLAGYHIDGTANFLPTPVFCSLKSFGRANTDNYWYINPGFRIDIFNGNDYVSFIRSMDNTNGTNGVLFTLLDSERDRTESFRVFYVNVEVFVSPLS